MENNNRYFLIALNVGLNILAAGLILFYSNKYTTLFNYELFFMLFISTAINSIPIYFPGGGNISVNFAIDVANILIFNPLQVVFIASFSFILSEVITNRKNIKIYNITYNNAQIIIINFVSWIVFYALKGNIEKNVIYNILPLLLSTAIYISINYSLVSIYFAIKNNISLSKMYHDFKFVIPNYIALTPIGYISAYLFYNIGPLGIILFFIPLLLARHTFKLYIEMRDMYLNTISSLAVAIDAKDKYTSGHSDRVSQYVVAISRELRLKESEIENLKYIALLHDIGKIAVPERILNKPSKLSEEEFKIMKYHTEFGAEIVKNIKFLNASNIIRSHHERIDGKGYPDGLKAQDIPLGSKIIAVADSFDAMTSDRPYRKALTNEMAFDELDKYSNSQFDFEVVQAFKRAYINFSLKEPQSGPSILTEELQAKIQAIMGGDNIAL